MSPYLALSAIVLYSLLMLFVSAISSRGKGGSSFFANHSSSWWAVAIGMIGACMSGVTFISVPGMVGTQGFSYLQMCIGFLLGYIAIAYVLVPLYFKLGVVSIYQYLNERFGLGAYKTGASLFFISKILGASLRLYLVCVTLQVLVFGPLGLPFILNAAVSMCITLLYTFKGGVKSVIGNDILKTIFMLVTTGACMWFISSALGISLGSLPKFVKDSGMSRVFYFDNPSSPLYFFKQVTGGLFTVIAMTGLDQDMMQRTLNCKKLGDAQKQLIISSILQIVVIFIFLCLGVLLYGYASAQGISASGDELFPAVAAHPSLPQIVGLCFAIGLSSCAFASSGSALTALTTSFSVDILGTEKSSVRTRNTVHAVIAFVMALLILLFRLLSSESTIVMVYKLASYTYGPLLGLFAFGILTKKSIPGRGVALVSLLSPLLCLILEVSLKRFASYQMGYELLLINALITFLGLLFCKKSE